VWALQRQPELAAVWMLALGGAMAVAGLVTVLRASLALPVPVPVFARIVLGAALGFAWAGIAAHARLSDGLDAGWEGRDLQLTGVIASLPQPVDGGARFEFDVERVQPAQVHVPGRVLLVWYDGLSPEEFQEPIRAV